MTSVVLVDDEEECLDVLEAELNKFCPDFQILQKLNNPVEAVEYINHTPFDVLFLDISMPLLNGFDLLKQVKQIDFDVIFVTAYDNFALKAFEFCAVDYLVKPTNKESIIRAAERIRDKQKNDSIRQNIALLLANMQKDSIKRRQVAIPTLEGFEFVSIHQITYAKAEGNYTTIVLQGQEKILISKTLKEFEGILNDSAFARIHNSYVVNLEHVKKYIKGESGSVVLNDGTILQVSRANKSKLLSRLS
ncbi:LytR/AlgR family response regulator transcription factor [Emticicia fontis]